MKKYLLVLLFLAGCSAFAVSPNCCGIHIFSKPKAQKKTHEQPHAAVSDMVMFHL